MKKIYLTLPIFILALSMLTGCSNEDNNIQNNSVTEEASKGLPELNGDYAYMRVKVISKDTESKTMKVKVVDFGSYSGVNIGSVPVDSEGELDCSALFQQGVGIKEGAEWIVSYKDEQQSCLPLRIYSIESVDYFAKRVK